MNKSIDQGATVLQVLPQETGEGRVAMGPMGSPVVVLASPPMGATPYGAEAAAAQAKPRLHPLVAVAALAVVAVSGVGIWAMVRGSAVAPAAVAVPVAACPACGKVRSIALETRQGEASVEGTVAGAAVGGLVANQLARGSSRRDAATVLGAVGGAFAGREIEKKVKTHNVWHITVDMEEGAARHFYWRSQPPWQSGDAVKVVDGKLTTAPAAPKTATP